MTAGNPATLNELFFDYAAANKHAAAFSIENPDGSTTTYSSSEFVSTTLALRDYFLRLGLAPGDRVAILSDNRPEWHIADFAVLLSHLVSVPLYTTLAPSQMTWIVEHSECRAICFAEKYREIAEAIGRAFPYCRYLISLDGGADSTTLQRIAESKPVITPELRTECLSARPDDTASVVYTSGTTGQPKGVMLSHDNICFDLAQCIERLEFRGGKQALSVLPLSHVFERLLAYGYFRMGVPIAYGDPHDLRQLLKRFRPDVMGCVPRILEKIKENVEAEIGRAPKLRQKIARALIASSMSKVHNGERPGLLADALLWSKIRRQLPELNLLVVGGAWLNPSVEVFFRSAGMTVLQGYGLTETSPVISLNGFTDSAIGTVGKPLQDVEVTIDPGGEILTRGRHVMKGYFQDPAATAAAFDKDRWLRTGDLGNLDSKGRLSVTGRIKELLVLSTGKNVSCALVEQALCRSSWIERAFVVGDGRKFTAAVIVPSVSALAGRELDKAIGDPAFCENITQEIATISAQLAEYERVKRFCFLSPGGMEDYEIFTPTQKLKRSIFARKYAVCIDRMYKEERPFLASPTPALEHARSTSP